MYEPGIRRYGDALWYCYAVVTTIGFGDITVRTTLARAISIFLSAYSVLALAIVTGVVVNYYNQIVALRQRETLTSFIDKLERLPELDPEELVELSERVKSRQFRKDIENEGRKVL